MGFVSWEKWVKDGIYLDATAVDKWLGAWKKQDWRVTDKRLWGSGQWLDLWEWAQRVTIFASHANAHWRASPMEGVLHRQVNKMTQPVDASWPVSLATPASAQWIHGWSGYDSRMEGSYACTTSMGCWLPRLMERLPLHNVLPTWNRSTINPSMAPSTGEVKWPTGSKLTFGALSLLEGAETHFDRNSHIFLQLWVCLSYLKGFSQHHQMKVYRVFDLPA